ncbi:hypothetical protein CNMCM5878_003226 [Aspergillus fumigatiaffinis]|jgi:nucleoside phosphorylase|nr:hypothetical protein CNMCM5878_003226 [Aspergillus fumigatiaffinis]KAF4219757.1 hypothetical protein CNMCM6457_002827 [Aspergillus fumigatiaffinis]
MSPRTTVQHNDIEIGIVCALSLEAHAVRAVFDEIYEDERSSDASDGYRGIRRVRKASGDKNAYTTGKIGHHEAVLAHIPGIGKANAAAVASSITSSFEGLRLVLLVGICGGMPEGHNNKEIMLGDVIIGKNVIQYDFGKQYPGEYKRKDKVEDSLGRQGPEIRAFVRKLESGDDGLEESTLKHLTFLVDKPGWEKSRYPGEHEDRLFLPDYQHKHRNALDCACVEVDMVCEVAERSSCKQLNCDTNKSVLRNRSRASTKQRPAIHFGSIASGDTVMKSGQHRNRIAKTGNIIAFEMEGAGLWDYVPCIIVKGVCDYADSHKNDDWQKYAAATAAACTKAILERWDQTDKHHQQYQVVSLIIS